MNAPAQEGFDQRLSRRSTLARRVDDSIHQRRAAFYRRHLLPEVPEGRCLLDVGAGDGLLIEGLARDSRARSARGFDIEPRSLGSFEVEVYDGKHLPLADGAADVTICVTVLHHCDEAERVLGEIRRVTAQRLLLVEDRFDSRLDRFGVIGFHHYLSRVESMPFDPNGFRSTEQWRGRLEKAGFRVRACRPLGRAVWWFPIVNTLFVADPA